MKKGCARSHVQKHPFNPARLTELLCVCGQVLSLVGLYPVANLCNLVMVLLVATVCVWAYSRYSGEYTELAASIDELTEQAWQNVSRQRRHLAGRGEAAVPPPAYRWRLGRGC